VKEGDVSLKETRSLSLGTKVWGERKRLEAEKKRKYCYLGFEIRTGTSVRAEGEMARKGERAYGGIL